MDSWRAWRQPVAWLLGAAGIATVVGAVLAVLRAANATGMSAAVASPDADPLPIALTVALVLAGLACLGPPTTAGNRWAAGLAGALVVVAGLGDLARLGMAVAMPPPDTAVAPLVAGLVAALLVEAAGLVALAGAAWARAASEPETPAPRQVPAPSTAAPSEASTDTPPTPTVWSADQAAGSVWHRAGDAATGAAGVTSPTPGGGARRSPDWRPARPTDEPDRTPERPDPGDPIRSDPTRSDPIRPHRPPDGPRPPASG